MALEKLLMILVIVVLWTVGAYQIGEWRGEKKVHALLDPKINAIATQGEVQNAATVQKEEEDVAKLRSANEAYRKEIELVRSRPPRRVFICPDPPGRSTGEVPGATGETGLPESPAAAGMVPGAVGSDIGRQVHDLLLACEDTAAAAREASAAWPRRRSN